MLSRFVRPAMFALVGVISTLVDFTIFFALLHSFSDSVLAANVVSYSCGILVSYTINRNLTFKDRAVNRVYGPILFFASGLIGLAINTIVVLTFVGFAGPLAAKLIATVATFVWNYLVSNLLIFRGESRGFKPASGDECALGRSHDKF